MLQLFSVRGCKHDLLEVYEAGHGTILRGDVLGFSVPGHVGDQLARQV